MAGRRDRRSRRLAAAAALTAGALLLGACGSDADGGGDDVVSGVQRGDADTGYHGAYLDDPYPASDTALQDTDGEQVRLDQQEEPLRLVFFGYTNCPDICQVVMSTMASAVTRLSAEQQEQVEGVFVTTDPARDTKGVIREYVDRYNPDFTGLTGSLSQVVEVAEKFHIFVKEGKKLPSGGYEVEHGTYVIGVTPEGGTIVWNDRTSPNDMAEDIQRLLEDA